MEEGREGEDAKKESEQEAEDGLEEKDTNLCRSPKIDNDIIPNHDEVIPSHFRSSAKRQLPTRAAHTLNYAFGKPRIDEVAQEAQDWLDGLTIAQDEEENNRKPNIFPHGLKYRSALANLSPQMLDRLQRCEENQEPYEPPKNPRIRCGKRNASLDVHAGLHELDCCNQPNNVWKGRRSAAGNSSSSVYAILHPQAEVRYKRKKSPKKKKPTVKRNHLREHLAAIAEMSSLTHLHKEKERQSEAERRSAIKYWGDRELPKKTMKTQKNCLNTNFAEKNMANIIEQSACVRALREDSRPDFLSTRKENIGRVPEYLQRIKTEIAQEAERRAIEEAAKSFPTGRRMMSEVNRRHILQKLENRFKTSRTSSVGSFDIQPSEHKELINTLKSFPLMFDTPRQIRLKSNTEQQLRSIEALHSYYDNPKVFTSCLDINCPTCMCINNHFFQDSERQLPNSHDGDIWEHMACAAGIQTSPKRNANFETGGTFSSNRGALGATSLNKKRRSQEGEFYVSPSKRQNASPKKLIQQSSSRWDICKKCSTTGQLKGSAKHDG